jgi:hypothetical protein
VAPKPQLCAGWVVLINSIQFYLAFITHANIYKAHIMSSPHARPSSCIKNTAEFSGTCKSMIDGNDLISNTLDLKGDPNYCYFIIDDQDVNYFFSKSVFKGEI